MTTPAHVYEPLQDGRHGDGRRCAECGTLKPEFHFKSVCTRVCHACEGATSVVTPGQSDARDYQAFLAAKRRQLPPTGIDVTAIRSPHLFDWQAEIVAWALRRGRAAIFASTGLGKTRQQLAWADVVSRHTGGNVLILAPLAVAQQTIREGDRIGVNVRYARAQADVQSGITITNYDMLHAFDLPSFTGIVLDESSILKAHDSKTRQALTEGAARIPYRLCCTATPAPNDHMELGNHAEFLGIMTQQEMLAMYFVHDGGSTQDWRLKGHARADFWRWVAGWAVLLRMPSDIGYDDAGYLLPPLRTHLHGVDADRTWLSEQGYLLAPDRLSLTQSRQARRASLTERVAACAALVAATPGPWLVFCDLNEESAALSKAIAGAVEVKGSDPREHKERSMIDFADGQIRVVVSKASICGWGMNFQHCHQIAFVGVNYSYELYFQAVRRCWRFGQTAPVDVHVFLSDAERAIFSVLEEKGRAADEMRVEMVRHMAAITRAALGKPAQVMRSEYAPQVPITIPEWLLEDAA